MIPEQRLDPSDWTVTQARSMIGGYRQIAGTDDEYNGVELFDALCGYLDELYGGEGFDGLLTDRQRAVAAAAIERIRTGYPTGSVLPDDDDDDDLDDDDLDDDPEVVVRLDQPVNAAVTLADGRALAERLAAGDGWQRRLGLALTGTYGLLDELYGGPGSFVELLDRTERGRVADELSGLETMARGQVVE